MITRASSICGMGDALNQMAFLIAYCKQKGIKTSDIAIYTEKYWWAFDGLGFKRGNSRADFRGLVAHRNFGFYDLPKIYTDRELDKAIAKNAGIDYSFEVCVPLPQFEPPKIDLPKRFITFNTGFGDLSGKPGNKDYVCLKSWPVEYWEEFIYKIGVPCVQIGAGPSCVPINGAALNLIDKLTIKESAEVMRKGLFHIDMEGGLSILNQHLGKKSVVLFGPTAIENQGRSFNLNIRSNVCSPCYEWGINRKKRLFEHKLVLDCAVKCMRAIKPSNVIEQIKSRNWLNGRQFVEDEFILDISK